MGHMLSSLYNFVNGQKWTIFDEFLLHSLVIFLPTPFCLVPWAATYLNIVGTWGQLPLLEKVLPPSCPPLTIVKNFKESSYTSRHFKSHLYAYNAVH